MDAVSKAKARMLFSQPFFATLLLSTPLIEDRTIPTACTDMRTIRYNPAFFEPMSVGKIMFVLAHEVLHIAFMHGLRRGARDHRLFNIAADYAINWLLHEAGFEWPGDGCLDAQYAGMSAEVIYDKLKQNKDKSLQQSLGAIGEDLMEPGSGSGNDGKPGPDGQQLSSGSGMSQDEQAELERQIGQKVAQAAAMARMAGKMTGNLARIINEILDPAVPWQSLLRDYMTRVTLDNESWQRRNRRFDDIYLPARHNLRMGEIVVIGDTSGSITEQELDQVAAEVRAISDQMNPERIRMLWADTKVKKEEVFEPGDELVFGPVGRGGTDMRVPLAYAEQYEPQVTILITDGETPWPDAEPPYPLIVVCTTKANVPVGLTVRV